MFQISFDRVSFSQAAKYLFVLQIGNEIKRTNVCKQWTSAPNINNTVKFDEMKTLTIKACTFMQEKQLKVIGSCQILLQQYEQITNNKTIVLEKDIINKLEGKLICVGKCNVIIRSLMEDSQTSSLKGSNINYDELQLKSEQNLNEENICQLRFLFHCGFNFYLGTSFRIQIKWGNKILTTKSVKDKIHPIWAQNKTIRGSTQTQFILSILDAKQNVLQWVKFNPQNIRLMFPYHFRIVFRQEICDALPEIFLTIVRQDIPLYSIIESKINLFIKPIDQNRKQKQILYVLIETSTQLTLPQFINLNLNAKIAFEDINKIVNNFHWCILLPLALQRNYQEPDISILKSLINKNLDIYLFYFKDWKAFSERNNKYLQIENKDQGFQTILKRIYYHNEKYSLGKKLQITNADQQQESINENISNSQKWRIMSNNYQLRQKMIKKSNDNIIKFRSAIENKGQQIVYLKKIVKQVKDWNKILISKQQSALVHKKQESVKVLKGKYDTQQIIQILFLKQSQLQKRKQINDQLRSRMQTLVQYQNNFQQLDNILIKNAHQLHKQQQNITKLNLIKETIPKQREVIGKLEKIFEHRELDKQMNMLLNQQEQKLNSILANKRKQLQNVYETVHIKQKDKHFSLKSKIQAAQKQLIRLNGHYAKLKTYQ